MRCLATFPGSGSRVRPSFDEIINTFDPDALIVGGAPSKPVKDFQRWVIDEIRAGMPTQREEQADIPILVMPHGDSAGARGAAIEALKLSARADSPKTVAI